MWVGYSMIQFIEFLNRKPVFSWTNEHCNGWIFVLSCILFVVVTVLCIVRECKEILDLKEYTKQIAKKASKKR